MHPEHKDQDLYPHGDEDVGRYGENGEETQCPISSGPITWPVQQRTESIITSSDIKKKGKKTDIKEKDKTKKYIYEQDGTFQLALRYFNRRWEKPVHRNTKPPRKEDQDIYIEKIGCFNSSGAIIKCRRCKDEVNGRRYYVNENKQTDILCQGCLGRKLKKEVGTNEVRLAEELKWLSEKDLLPKMYNQFSFGN